MAEQMAVLQQLLLATLDPRPSVRQAAEQQLTAARQTDLGQFVGSMAALIALDQPLPGPQGAPGSPEDLLIAKQIAAVTFKNSISAKDLTLDGAAAEAWRALPNETKADIKKQLLAALHTDCIQVGNAVCQVLAKLGVIELRSMEFEGLLPALQEMVQQAVSCQQQQQQQQQLLKACGRHALTCLAYLCEELADIVSEGEDPSEVFSEQRCNVVLTAVLLGLKDPDPQLKVAALRALYHALVFAKGNFNKKVLSTSDIFENTFARKIVQRLQPDCWGLLQKQRFREERDYIINSVVEAGDATNPSAVQVAAFDCIVQISQEYYSLLEAYMPAMGPVRRECSRGWRQLHLF
ncbi:importin subunit beta-1, putative [Eimeria necatrix]|uniref:Importin subunit beta-1, putative n=1 Tax=Eimeria necatrix TaxID=51315 RepID=U6N1M8_9EIME|nr:importin subunit beta-1, putative [Eimeria necatrix]CDJ67850.1 importin subunit beta-1, putative [Eimeria necatrix]